MGKKRADQGPSWDPGAAWDGCPVAHIPAAGIPGFGELDYWGILSFEEVAKAATDFGTFSSVTPDGGPRILPLQSDPPEHGSYRRGLNRYFQPTAVAKLEAEVRPFCEEMIAAMVRRRRVDFVETFAAPFPTRVLCRFLGLEDSDWELHHEWVMAMEETTGDGLAKASEAVPSALAERIMPYVREVVDARRAEPGEDIVSGMVDLEIDGRPLDREAACYLMITFMLGGHITTSGAIGSLVLRLASDQELQGLLRANPERIPDAIEESLRLDTPQQAMPRRCLHDTEVAGQPIRAGERVVLNFGSANVDPARWERPGEFDLDREDKRHVAFGRGVHACIAAAMARMEMRLAVEVLLARTESFELDGEVRRLAWPRLAVESLPLALRPVAVA